MNRRIMKFCPAVPLLAWFAAAPLIRAEMSVSGEASYATRYVFRGVKFGAEAFQPTLTAKLGDVDVGYWANHPFNADENIERDYSVGYSFSRAGVDFRAGAQAYTYPQVSAPETEKTYEFSFSGSRVLAEKDERQLSASLTAYYDVRLDALTVESSLAQTINVRPWLSLNGALTVGKVAGYNLTPDAEPPKVVDSYSYGAAKIEARVSLGKCGYLRLGGQWDTTHGLNSGDADLGGNTSGWIAVGFEW